MKFLKRINLYSGWSKFPNQESLIQCMKNLGSLKEILKIDDATLNISNTFGKGEEMITECYNIIVTHFKNILVSCLTIISIDDKGYFQAKRENMNLTISASLNGKPRKFHTLKNFFLD